MIYLAGALGGDGLPRVHHHDPLPATHGRAQRHPGLDRRRRGGGQPLDRLIQRCGPDADAGWIVFCTFDGKGVTGGEGRYGIRRIEFRADHRDGGQGMGGCREDQQFYANSASI